MAEKAYRNLCNIGKKSRPGEFNSYDGTRKSQEHWKKNVSLISDTMRDKESEKRERQSGFKLDHLDDLQYQSK